MRVDMHNHTIYCNHANGSMREYIERSIELNIDVFGFSCHAPMEFDKKYRMDEKTLEIYLKEIQNLKCEYSGKIEILSALEVDFILGREDLVLQSVLEANVDYLIGSVHFLGEWGFDNPEFIGQWEERGTYATWESYLDSLQEMAKSRHFQITGHIDLPKLFGNTMPRNLVQKCADTLEIIHKNGMILEINAAGLRKNIKEAYPSKEILQIAKEIGLDITLSSDAHEVSQIGYGYDLCVKLAKEVGYDKACIFRGKRKEYVALDSISYT